MAVTSSHRKDVVSGAIEMKKRGPYREPVRVEFHLSGGYTRVVFERVPGAWRDIPTSSIPPHLLRLGSRFLLVYYGITPEEQDTPAEIRAAIVERIEELPTEQQTSSTKEKSQSAP